jgi:hypothetical protein
MRRFLLATFASIALGSGVVAASACSDSAFGTLFPPGEDAARDGKLVTPDDGAAASDAGPGQIPPSCQRYCELVDENCTGASRQYASEGDCLAFCAHLADGKPGEIDQPTLACRQYYAGNPSRANPEKYCRAAGPFGGDNECGSRCTAFCDVALSACGDGGAPYAAKPDCENACTGYKFVDASADGGGESPAGPTSGDTLNCRLYWLRKAVNDAGACAALRQQSTVCN